MANTLGRISGQLLKDNLTREGRELAFDTDLLFLNVGDRRIGANTDVPTKPLEINGTTTTINTQNLNVADKFILLSSGSTSVFS